ncbi:hypothetical protein [Alicyclobacillus dauci]|uniref:Transposase n=1 Tax=Alicyclobacillus dauci TaxID=1475485 RepID=A0ABY6Z9G8_9BACL|nr:hypothetical protein [Alicyclobacillus dauci]WAH39522.1 hypothetical protein NZD86_24455 [Alicyclobacillus dauci]WAH39582.1 hypothetical protein NZD86_24155 [Alicyclobacillus dauci]
MKTLEQMKPQEQIQMAFNELAIIQAALKRAQERRTSRSTMNAS